MITKIVLALVLIVAVVLIVAAFRPPAFHYSRSVLIATPPAVPFAEVNDFHRWPAWSPYEKLDPAMKRTYEGPSAGVGAIYSWEGNGKVGSGKMTVVESRPGELIRFKLEFFAPMAGLCEATFVFRPENGQTRVSWAMTGSNSYPAKVIGLFMNMDQMIGGQFEQGLVSLKAVAESAK